MPQLATLSYTHFQPAQPTTVGRRACLWMQDFLIDLGEVEYRSNICDSLGVKGATGTQASFLALFDNDQDKVNQLETFVAHEMDFHTSFAFPARPIRANKTSGSLLPQQFCCLGTQIRYRFPPARPSQRNRRALREKASGSSAMPYKRNPMRSERICGLSRFLMSLNENPLYTQATQWFERTLDDSANRSLYLPEAFSQPMASSISSAVSLQE